MSFRITGKGKVIESPLPMIDKKTLKKMEKKELVNLLKKEVSKKKFKENFFEELLREHEDTEISLSDDKILSFIFYSDYCIFLCRSME